MDKRIIIDGVDVSACNKLYNIDFEFDTHVHCSDFFSRNTRCRNNPNCYYKQLQREKQECKNKQKTLDYYLTKTTQLLDDIDNLHRVNEELQGELDEVQEENKELRCHPRTPSDCFRARKYRQALKEIGKIAEDNHLCYLGPYQTDKIKQILQKVKEATDVK